MIARLRGPYAIIDVGERHPAERALDTLDRVLTGGIELVQLRAKGSSARLVADLARAFRARTTAAGAVFVVNDRPDIAQLVEADAVHLGQEDLAIADVRRWLAPGVAIGVSCHSVAQVEAACAAGADYLGYGPVFATHSKARPDPVVGLEGLRAACAAAGATPVVGIGGIKIADLARVRDTGARGAAMIAALVDAADPAAAAREAVAAWGP